MGGGGGGVWGYSELDRSERLCDKCNTGAVEDEQHFLIKCSKLNEYINSLFFKLLAAINLDNFQTFFWWLTNVTSDMLNKIG